MNFRNLIMNRTRRQRSGRLLEVLSALACLGATTVSLSAQATNEITDINPNSAAQGMANVLVTFTLDTDVPPAPPAGVLPDGATIGSLVGTSLTHDSQHIVTAVFDIAGDAIPGLHDATISFTTPDGALTFSMADGFEVIVGGDLPPTITRHPQSQATPPGGAIVFLVEAYGTEPLEYQWQKDGVDIQDAGSAVYTINPVDWDDAGDYRCIITNDFGSATSNAATLTVANLPTGAYPIVDTGQEACYDNYVQIEPPGSGDPFYGQDAQFDGNQPSYAISSDGLTVLDNVTGLIWMRDADLDGDGDIDADDKRSYTAAQDVPAMLNAINYGGYDDWRVPSIKELYSLMDFRGTDPMSDDPSGVIPFIDTDYFFFAYGDTAAGDRLIDSQWVTTTLYVGDMDLMFGVNFADGRIKGYGMSMPGGAEKTFYVRLCRGNPDYGLNNFTDNGDGTITDLATGLMWDREDSGDGIDTGPRSGMLWEEALAWVQQKNAESHRGHNDWRLPNAKEMQSILDYTRSPDSTDSGAIDPIFSITQITNEAGEADYPWFWTGTTHVREGGSGGAGAYICFGRGWGYMNDDWIDIHGAGCQRSDPKDGDFSNYSFVYDGYYHASAPQADVVRMYNYVRLVRDASTVLGDFNGDGCVDQADLGQLLSAYGVDAGGDLDGDGDTDQADLGTLLGNYGAGCS